MSQTPDRIKKPNLRLVAWEITKRCNLSCIHCRVNAVNKFDKEELSTKESFLLIDEIAKITHPTLILTGGEPLLRSDIFEIISYGVAKGLIVVMAPNGTLINKEIAGQMKYSGIKRISISLDGATAKTHDEMRQVSGAFEGALNGIKWAKTSGLEFQINTTVTKQNYTQIDDVIKLAIKLGAVACHFFFWVPTGRTKEMVGQELNPGEYEEILTWLAKKTKEVDIEIRTTCAPHYFRISREPALNIPPLYPPSTRDIPPCPPLEGVRGKIFQPAGERGCLAGTAFCFISYQGEVFPCGYLDINCGNIKNQSFKDIWENSQVFNALRDLSRYRGKCGRCEYLKICGGCRARAYAKTGDYLEEEPNCIYEPKED